MSEIVLRGLDGSNPLAFLAALGALRLLTFVAPDVRLHWRNRGTWQPVLTGLPEQSEDVICQMILDAPAIPVEVILAALGKNLTVAADVFLHFVQTAITGMDRQDHRAADFAAAFGSEVCQQERKDRIQYTDLCFITGSGHQDFIDTAANLLRHVDVARLRDALFGPWRYEKGLSMRWDPADAREYALRWNDPGPEGVRAVWGANRLAVEALPFFPAHPEGKQLKTTGFREHRPFDEFTWPLWVMAVSHDTVRSLVSLRELQEDEPDRSALNAMGVEEVFRVQRVRIGMGANFKVSFRPARSV
jgi:hypothetical protein